MAGTDEDVATPQATTVREQVVQTLRDAIMTGEFEPGQRMPEAELCRRLDISRTTLREALRSLEAERLVDIVPNRGPSVARLGVREVEEIHELWAVLTTEAIGRFTALARESDVIAMQGAIRRLNKAGRTGDVIAQLSATEDFFRVAYRRCGNRLWNETIVRLLSRIHFLRAMALKTRADAGRLADDLSAIVAAVQAQDPDAARTATRDHINRACLAARRICLERTDAAPSRKG